MNDANKANFEEINGHIAIIKAKMGNSGAATEKLIEDLEDYYERGMQLRVMHNTTLQSELEDANKRNMNLRKHNRRLLALWIGLCITIAVAIVVFTCPQCLSTVIRTRFFQQMLPLLAAAIVSSALTFAVLRNYHRVASPDHPKAA